MDVPTPLLSPPKLNMEHEIHKMGSLTSCFLDPMAPTVFSFFSCVWTAGFSRSGKTTVLGKLSASLDAFDPEAHRQVQVPLESLESLESGLPVDPRILFQVGNLVVDHEIIMNWYVQRIPDCFFKLLMGWDTNVYQCFFVGYCDICLGQQQCHSYAFGSWKSETSMYRMFVVFNIRTTLNES